MTSLFQQNPTPDKCREDCETRHVETRDERAARQLAESKDAVKEAVGVMARAMAMLENAVKDMDQFGEPPLADLE